MSEQLEPVPPRSLVSDDLLQLFGVLNHATNFVASAIDNATTDPLDGGALDTAFALLDEARLLKERLLRERVDLPFGDFHRENAWEAVLRKLRS